MPEITFPVEVVSGVPVVAVPEEIDITNAAGLRAALLEATAEGTLEATAKGTGALVVDMSRTQYCDSAGLNVLVRAHHRLRAGGGEMLLVISGAAVVRIFAVSGVDHVIRTFPTLGEAIAQTSSAALNPPPPAEVR